LIAITITVPVVLVVLLIYVVTNPEKAEKVAGWIWRGVAGLVGVGERKAVAYSVQGDVNSARSALMKDVPDGVIGGKLKLKWAKPEEAQAKIGDGEVVVFMRKSRHREENITNAVMAYLPKAVVPRARNYVDRKTMRAVDLTLARAILQASHMPSGTLDTFFERHLEPALAESGDLRERLVEVDAIDLHGWLTRVMLGEYRRMAGNLYPYQCDQICLNEARALCVWLGQLAQRKPFDYTIPLQYKGRYFNIGIIFVAMKGKIEAEGLTPYRKRAKKLIYEQKCDAVYLMARDANIRAVKELRDDLGSDALVDEVATYEYRLRSDFKARMLHRERGIVVVLRRRQVGEGTPVDEADLAEIQDEEIEVYDFEQQLGAHPEEPKVVSAGAPKS
jgi:hypothetical protein